MFHRGHQRELARAALGGRARGTVTRSRYRQAEDERLIRRGSMRSRLNRGARRAPRPRRTCASSSRSSRSWSAASTSSAPSTKALWLGLLDRAALNDLTAVVYARGGTTTTSATTRAASSSGRGRPSSGISPVATDPRRVWRRRPRGDRARGARVRGHVFRLLRRARGARRAVALRAAASRQDAAAAPDEVPRASPISTGGDRLGRLLAHRGPGAPRRVPAPARSSARPNAPLLVSFLFDPGIATLRYFARCGQPRREFARRRKLIERGDALTNGFTRHFGEAELRDELSAGGFETVELAAEPYSHAVARARLEGRVTRPRRIARLRNSPGLRPASGTGRPRGSARSSRCAGCLPPARESPSATRGSGSRLPGRPRRGRKLRRRARRPPRGRARSAGRAPPRLALPARPPYSAPGRSRREKHRRGVGERELRGGDDELATQRRVRLILQALGDQGDHVPAVLVEAALDLPPPRPLSGTAPARFPSPRLPARRSGHSSGLRRRARDGLLERGRSVESVDGDCGGNLRRDLLERLGRGAVGCRGAGCRFASSAGRALV